MASVSADAEENQLGRSAKSEGESLNSRIGKLYFKLPIRHGTVLPNQLIESLRIDDAQALRVRILAVRGAGRFAVHENAKANGLSVCRGTENEVQVSCMETEHNATAGLVQDGRFRADGPIAREGPLVEVELYRQGVCMTRIRRHTAW